MRAIDLFCGAGGFSAGVARAGIDVEYGVDVSTSALATFEANHDAEALAHDVRDGVPDAVRESSPDLVFGSPPCQGFSDARGERRLDDERNGLVFSFVQWVGELEPDAVLMENVAGMTTIGDDFLAAIEREFADVGYEVTWETLNAASFGIPQTRERVIYLGVPSESGLTPTLPAGEYREDGDGQLSLTGDPQRGWTTVADALADLPEPTTPDADATGGVDLSPLSAFPDNDYLPLVRDGATRTYNHVAKRPADDPDTRRIVSRLAPGEMYRSSRFGDRYRGVWDLLPERFDDVERDALRFVARNRTRKQFRMGEKEVGAVPGEAVARRLEHDDDSVLDALASLHERGWLRTDERDGRVGYDLNTKSGIRPRYMRLEPDGQANTILTTDFNPRDKLHPTDDRGLSLREGARVQSFPDTFRFRGSFGDVATQIGNAVPPLMARALGEHVRRLVADASPDAAEH